MDSTQNIISFCTGYGGIELGLKLAGLDVRTIAYVEIEAFACANLVAKIEQGKMDAAPIWTDIKTFDGKPFRDRVHGIIGGYPCQPFSVAGKQQGEADERHLWPFIKDCIREINPVWCFFENVAGHLSLGFDRVVSDLDRLSYTVEAGIFSAAETGAPHRRERLFILGYAKSDLRRTPWHDRRKPLDRASAKELANTEKHDGRSCAIQSETQRPQCGCGFWPARPGQEQHGWEAPRTLGNARSGTGDAGRARRTGQSVDKRLGNQQQSVKSGMGRTVNGFASRVDELRLLGNGVVPQTAELAWKTLTEMIK